MNDGLDDSGLETESGGNILNSGLDGLSSLGVFLNDREKKQEAAQNDLSDGEKKASEGGLGGNDTKDKINGAEKNPKGLYAGKGKAGEGGKELKNGAIGGLTGGGLKTAGGGAKGPGGMKNLVSGKKAPAPETMIPMKSKGKGKGKGFGKASAGIGAIVAVVVLMIVVVSAPMYMIGSIDYNMQRTVGIEDTSAVLEEQGEYVTEEMAIKGEMPGKYARDLAVAGIELGQTTVAGEFLPLDEVASLEDNFYKTGNSEAIAFRFEGEIIKADNFVAAVESNPRLYAAYSEAADISARFYYSDDVDEVFQDLDISRGNFNDWQKTGDSEADMESFKSLLEEALSDDSEVEASGCEGMNDGSENGDESNNGSCREEGSFRENISSSDNAEEVTSVIAEKTTGSNATSKAAQLLNAAIASDEPRKAAKAFVAIEEPLQRARIDGDGPVNEMMNTLSAKTEVTYTDAATGELVTTSQSILGTKNFAAAMSGKGFSQEEANNFSQDRVLQITGTGEDEIEGTVVVTDGKGHSAPGVGIENGASADSEVIEKASNSVELGILEDGAESFSSVVGANRSIEGGSHLSNEINKKVLAAMASDEETILNYNREVEKVLARRAEADRATKSPFDISSPNTFFGSIAHNLSTIMLGSYANGGGVVLGAANVVAGGVGDSVAKLTEKAMADDGSGKFTTTYGPGVTVGKAAGAKADIYGTALRTITTKYMNLREEDWVGRGVINSDRALTNNGEKGYTPKDISIFETERNSTIGTQSAEVCEAYNEKYHNDIWHRISDFFSNLFGTYKVCNGVDEEVAGIPNGAAYVLKQDNPHLEEIEEFAGYTLYNEVYSLLSERDSSLSRYKKEYYAAHPKDNSRAGKIARRSGMTKAEAEVALAYADYLTEIANYDASSRFVFGKVGFDKNKSSLIKQAKKTRDDIYLMWHGKTEYADSRNRNFVV